MKFLPATSYPGVILLAVFCYVKPQGVMDYCEGETFRAICEPDEVVVMTSASYGRMNLGRCLRIDYGNIGCYQDILSTMDGQCSGRRNCEMRVSSIVDAVRNIPQDCPSDLRSYLEASYQCLKVTPAPQKVCQKSGFLVLNNTSGYIASVATKETSGGSILCPWVIKAKPGQRINFTLYDFGNSGQSGQSPSSYPDYNICQHVYATVKETSVTNTRQICGGHARVTAPYTSVTDTVELRIFSEEDNNNENYFVLKYDIIGCPDPEPPINGFIERTGDLVIVRCNGSSSQKRLKCDGHVWSGGEKPLCPGIPGEPGANPSVEFSIVIIASVAIIIASSVLTVGLLCIKRQRDRRAQRGAGRNSKSGPEVSSIYYSEGRKVDPRVESRGVPALPGEAFLPNENDYYRTWQLQRHAPAQNTSSHHAGSIQSYPLPPSSPLPQAGDNGSKYMFNQVEHIYESPKFERRDIQYYELDPSAVQSDNSSYPESSRNLMASGN